ncbi:MAG TPA: diguanylate cyclase [Casimicrobiaceae bacterium]|nr:diguanylate cyclase [Casimicrobiaceae bacterium]
MLDSPQPAVNTTTRGALHRTRETLLQLVLVPALFYGGAKLSLAFAIMPDVLVMLWIPNSILLATLLHYGFRRYGYFALAVILAELAADYASFPLIEAALFGLVNVLEVSIAYALLRQWRFDPRFATPGDIAKFVVAAPVVAAFASACGATAIYTHFGAPQATSWQLLQTWWYSDGLGLLLLLPMVLTAWPPINGIPAERPEFRWYDIPALAASLALMSAFALSHQRVFHGVELRSFLLIGPVLYAAARFNLRIAIAMVIGISAVVLALIKSGRQPFGDLPLRETVVLGQEFIFVITAMSLGLVALLSQYRARERELEQRVRERTAELTVLNSQLERLALTDSLTGLLNRRALIESLRREMARGHRRSELVSLIIFDIDHFKEVNDRYGHAAGDAALQRVAQIAAATVRESDILSRYGGEEFVVVAPDTDAASATRLAERLRVAMRSTDVELNGRSVRLTASFGVTTLGTEDGEADQALRRADEALYAAKAAGRDKVVTVPVTQ